MKPTLKDLSKAAALHAPRVRANSSRSSTLSSVLIPAGAGRNASGTAARRLRRASLHSDHVASACCSALRWGSPFEETRPVKDSSKGPQSSPGGSVSWRHASRHIRARTISLGIRPQVRRVHLSALTLRFSLGHKSARSSWTLPRRLASRLPAVRPRVAVDNVIPDKDIASLRLNSRLPASSLDKTADEIVDGVTTFFGEPQGSGCWSIKA